MSVWARATAAVEASLLLVAGMATNAADLRAEAAPYFKVHSTHNTHYYPVAGRTQEEIWAQLNGVANPLAVDQHAGTRPLGHATFTYRYDYQSAYGSNAANCRVDTGNLELNFDTVLPELANTGGIDKQLESRWLSFQDYIAEHEAGHHSIYRELVTLIPQAMQEIGEVPCSELANQVSTAVNEVVAAVRQASAEYDANYASETQLASSL